VSTDYETNGDGDSMTFSQEELPGESFMYEKTVRVSSQMQDIITHHPSFTVKLIGPVQQ